jgi:hypothetical protein
MALPEDPSGGNVVLPSQSGNKLESSVNTEPAELTGRIESEKPSERQSPSAIISDTNASVRAADHQCRQRNNLKPPEITKSAGLAVNAESNRASERQSFSGGDDEKPAPRKLGSGGKVLDVLMDTVGMLLCVGIIVFAILVRRANGNAVGRYEANLVEVAGIVRSPLNAILRVLSHCCIFGRASLHEADFARASQRSRISFRSSSAAASKVCSNGVLGVASASYPSHPCRKACR